MDIMVLCEKAKLQNRMKSKVLFLVKRQYICNKVQKMTVDSDYLWGVEGEM